MASRRIEVEIIGDARGFGRAVAEAESKSSRLGAALKGLGKTAALAGVAAAGFGFQRAVKSAATFEQQMNVLRVTSGATDAEMKRVSSTAMKLGADIRLPGTSASDAASAMVELSKGGLSVRESMDAARGTLQLSAAAQIENAEAAKIVADSLNAFGLRGKEAARVADLLAASSNATTASLPDMADALKQSSAVAKQMKLSIGDSVTALSLLANAGIKGSDAGTSLKTMLLKLGAPTAQAAEKMRDLGVSSFDAQGRMKPLSKIAGEYKQALSGMSDEQKAAALNTIFGSDAIRAANIILGKGSRSFDKMSAAVNKQGAAAKLAAAQNAGFFGALDGLKSVLETLALQVGLKVIPSLTKFLNFLSVGIPVALAAMRNAVATAMAWFNTNLMPTFRAAALRIRQIWGAVGGYVTAFTRVFLTTVVGVARGLLNVVVGVFKVVGALIRGDWSAMWNAVKQVASGALRAVVSLIRGAVGMTLAAAKAVGQAIWKGVKEGAKKLVELAGELIRMIGDAVKKAAAAALNLAAEIGKAIGQGVVNGVKSMAGAIGDAIMGIVTGPLGKLKGALRIGSPSKWVAENIGAPIGQGVTMGIDGERRNVGASFSRLAGSVMGVAAPSVGAGGVPRGVGSGGGGVTMHIHEAQRMDPQELARYTSWQYRRVMAGGVA